jgi:hypothetical protein
MKKRIKSLFITFFVCLMIAGFAYSADINTMARNPSFEDGTGEWQLLVTAPAAANWQTDKGGVDGKCVNVNVTAVSGTGWHVEIHQSGMALKAGQKYTFNFWAKTVEGETRVIQPGLEGIGGAGDWWQDFTVKGEWAEFSKTWDQSLAGSATIHFAVAQTKGAFLLDRVRLYEGVYQKEELKQENTKAVSSSGKLPITWGELKW